MRSLRLHRLSELLAVSCSVCLVMLGSLPCEANLGDTPEQIKARYGEVTYKFLSGGTFRFHRPGVETDTVDVAFQDGKSQWEAYHHWKSKALADIDSTGSFSTADIDSVLKANAQGLTWRKQAPSAKDLPGETTWLLGSNDPKTALAKAVSNNEQHSLALWLSSYDLDGHTDATTAAALAALFPAPKQTPEPVRVPVPLKPGVFPVLKILGQPKSIVNKMLGNPSQHWPIHEPKKRAGGTTNEYPGDTKWRALFVDFYGDKAVFTSLSFWEPFPASEAELFDVLGLPKSGFRKTFENIASTSFRGVVGNRVIEILAMHQGGVSGFCSAVNIELVQTLD